jgi:prevent-host-death family protein
MDVGVRELKQHLSEYLERAAAGEVIRVTDRGRPKAILGPVPGRVDLEAAVAEGWVTRGEERAVARVRPGRSVRRIADVVADDRDA